MVEEGSPLPPVLYEDAAVVVAVKPSGILSAPAEGKRERSLPELLSPGAPLFVVHRLDRPTAGVMVYAKTASAAAHLGAQGEMEKTYLAVSEGVPAEPSGALVDLLFFDRAKDKSFIVKKPRRGVKEARLSYEVIRTVLPDELLSNASLGEGGITAADGGVVIPPALPLTLLRVTLDTGRTHQIRAQFASRRLPLYGDRRYGAKSTGTLGLFACRLSFTHPTSGQRMTFEAPMPASSPFALFQI